LERDFAKEVVKGLRETLRIDSLELVNCFENPSADTGDLMKTNQRTETTLGNLIAALTEEVSRYVHDEKKAYEVVAFMLTDLLKNSSSSSGRRRGRY